MQFTIDQKPRFAHITGTGRLNMVGAPELREVVAKVVGEGSTHVVVDLGGTEFMDSSGLGALIGCLKLARQAGGDLRIANVRPQVRMVLELTSMHRVLNPYDTADAAFADD
ncbi:STAS domain-containing protein [Kocuria nitroreducens]|uniref:STAS domain-containing protein n=1 Tax=Kocuria nitroreducens TaxID=3058914 RepID=UPI0036D832E7